MKRMYLVVWMFFILLQGTCFASDLKRVNLALQWYPQAQFAGYYMAQAKGIYSRYGLDVRIITGSADSSSCDKLNQGEADFATAFLSTALKQRAEGVPLVNIGQFVQHSALMLITRKDSGIKSIRDFQGKRVGMWSNDFQIQPKALFKREGIHVDVIRQSPSFELFMRGGLDAVSAMWYNEYHTLMAYGLTPEKMTTFFFRDLGLNFPEDGLYTLNATLKKFPDTSIAMRKASAEGWKYAFAHPDETLDLIIRKMKNANIRANRAHQKWMLSRMKDILEFNKNDQLDTRLKKEDFEQVQKHLLSAGEIDSEISYEQFYQERN